MPPKWGLHSWVSKRKGLLSRSLTRELNMVPRAETLRRSPLCLSPHTLDCCLDPYLVSSTFKAKKKEYTILLSFPSFFPYLVLFCAVPAASAHAALEPPRSATRATSGCCGQRDGGVILFDRTSRPSPRSFRGAQVLLATRPCSRCLWAVGVASQERRTRVAGTP